MRSAASFVPFPDRRLFALAIALQSGYRYRQTEAESIIRDIKKVLDSTDRLAAAIFAAATCVGLNHHKPEDYLAHYDEFLKRMYEREFAALDGDTPEVVKDPAPR